MWPEDSSARRLSQPEESSARTPQPENSSARRLFSPMTLQAEDTSARRLLSPKTLQAKDSSARRLCNPKTLQAEDSSGRGLFSQKNIEAEDSSARRLSQPEAKAHCSLSDCAVEERCKMFAACAALNSATLPSKGVSIKPLVTQLWWKERGSSKCVVRFSLLRRCPRGARAVPTRCPHGARTGLARRSHGGASHPFVIPTH